MFLSHLIVSTIIITSNLLMHCHVLCDSFNQLDLPAYETYDKLRRMLILALNECSEGFGLA